ncbi:hypothetical protein ACOMHN_002843 [Nucella lapillus]
MQILEGQAVCIYLTNFIATTTLSNIGDLPGPSSKGRMNPDLPGPSSQNTMNPVSTTPCLVMRMKDLYWLSVQGKRQMSTDHLHHFQVLNNTQSWTPTLVLYVVAVTVTQRPKVPHPDLQSAVGNAPLSSKHSTHLPTTDCLLSITPLMGGQPSDAPALSPPSPLQQGGQSSNAPALSPPSPLPQGSQPIALALSPSSPLPQDGQPSDAPGLSPSSSTLLLCPSDSTLSICHLNSQSAVKTGPSNQDMMNPDLPRPFRQDMMNPDLSGPSNQDMMTPDLPGPFRQDRMSHALTATAVLQMSEERWSCGPPPGANRRQEMEAPLCDLCSTKSRDPRILPCSHTFCAWCIHGLAHTGRAFPCPACLRQTFLPPGGVASLPSIFDSETPTPHIKPGHQEMGDIRSQENVECYSMDCGQVDYPNHEHYRTHDVTSAFSHEQAELQPDQQYVQRAVPDSRQTMSLQQERQYLPQKRQMPAGTSSVDMSLYRPVLQSEGEELAPEVRVAGGFQCAQDPEVRVAGGFQCTQDPEVRVAGGFQCAQDPEVRVAGGFQCAQDPEAKVFSLCHVDKDLPEVRVSYEREDFPVQVFTETGELVENILFYGKVSFKRYHKGKAISPDLGNYVMCNFASGKAYMIKLVVTCLWPYQDISQFQFKMSVGPHRAFDMDDTEQYFAVVEEAKESTASRSVLLYKRPEEKAVNTYIPPGEPFQPCDVCFYTLRGQEVLLIADERRDDIHVVKMDRERLTFDHYLRVGDLPLVRPTAIAVDIQNRLWIACRGGPVMMLEQIK